MRENTLTGRSGTMTGMRTRPDRLPSKKVGRVLFPVASIQSGKKGTWSLERKKSSPNEGTTSTVTREFVEVISEKRTDLPGGRCGKPKVLRRRIRTIQKKRNRVVPVLKGGPTQ